MPRGHTPFHEWSVGQVAERSGVSVSALHFYEREGLIVSVRNMGNQRRYGRDVLRRLAFIRASQRVGIPLSTIKEALDELPLQRTPREADWGVVAARWKEVLEDQIDYLMRVEEIRQDVPAMIKHINMLRASSSYVGPSIPQDRFKQGQLSNSRQTSPYMARYQEPYSKCIDAARRFYAEEMSLGGFVTRLQCRSQ